VICAESSCAQIPMVVSRSGFAVWSAFDCISVVNNAYVVCISRPTAYLEKELANLKAQSKKKNTS